MWGPPGDHHAGVPDSEEDAWRIGYGEEGGSQPQEPAPAPARGGRPRYAATADSQRWGQQQPRAEAPQSPTLSGSSDAGPAARPGSPGADSAARPTLGEELQTVLHALTQHPDMQQQQQQQQQQRPALQSEWGALLQPAGAAAPAQEPQRRSGQRQMLTISPAIPAQQLPPEAGARVSGGRRWRQAQAAPAGGAQQQQQLLAGPGPIGAPGSSGGGGGGPAGDDFFAVDADLVQAAQRQAAAAQAKPRRQARAKQWDSPQAPAPSQLPLAAAPGAEHTPLPSQRANPLAALLGGGGGGSSAKPRAATTGGRLRARGQHPLHSQMPALVTTASPAGSSRPAAAAGWGGGGGGAGSVVAGGSSSSAIREALGLRAPPLTSPRQLQQQQQRRPQHPPHQHSRFAVREPAAAAAAAAEEEDSAAAAQPVAGLQALIGEPPSTAHKQRFQPRPKRPEAPREGIEDEEEEDEGAAAQGGAAAWQQPPQQQWQQPQQQQWQADGASAADSFRTPGQPIRHRSWQDAQEEQQQQQQQQQQPAPGTGGSGAPGSSGGKGGAMSVQRAFIAQLQPVSRPAVAASLQQQKQRLAGTAGLYARMQAILAAERAAAECAPSPAAGSGPRLTVLDKQLEGSLTKCLCRCDATAAAALGAPQVLALLQNRTAREVDTAPGSVLLLREPWRVLQVPDSPHPVVLCWSAVGG